MNLDKILAEEVGFGRYQSVTLVFTSLVAIFYVLASGEHDYTAAKIPHRCRIPACDGSSNDVTQPEFRPSWLLNAINGESLDDFESCSRFADSISEPSYNETCPAEWFDRTLEVDCDEYVYENTNTAVYDFDLGCNEGRRTMEAFTLPVTALMLPAVGGLGDNFGRRPVLIITVFCAACFGFVRSFITSYVAFLVLRVIQVGLGCTAFVFCYVIGIELVSPNHRVIVGAILSTTIPLGHIILGLVAYAVTWRTLLLIVFTPQLLVLGYLWIISESVRWLIYKKKYTQSEVILNKIAKCNRKPLSDATINDLQALVTATKNADKEKQRSVIGLVWKTPGIISRIAMGLLWYVTYSAIEYAMEKKIVNLTDQSHLNNMYVTAFAILGIWTAVFLLDRIGRKQVLIGGYLLVAACQFALAFIPEDSTALYATVYLIAKYFLGAVTSSINLYTLESFPTEFRTLIFGYFYMHTLLGHTIGSLIASLGTISWIGLPSILFSCLAMFSGLLFILAPETRSAKLPDTMEEAAQINKENNTNTETAHNIERMTSDK